jgi:molybdopterin/thiamine biosynthesis adenylyltransferase
MTPAYWLVLPPRAWREQISRIAQSGSLGVAHLARNFYADKRELIARELRPLATALRGRDFGPLDDLLLVWLQATIEVEDLHRLLARFTPSPRQLVAGLVLGREAAAGRWLGGVWDSGIVYPLEGLTLVGPGMRRITATQQSPEETGLAYERWSRTRGALGEAVWRRVRESCVAVIGAGRNGSIAVVTLAMLGVGRLILIDEDREELHNLDATLGANPDGLGQTKVVNRLSTLKDIRPDDLDVQALAHSVLHPGVAEVLRCVDLLVTCVDRDGPRLAAALIANRWCKIHLDTGTGVFVTGASRQMGADVRLLLPGEACVVCLGGLRNPGEAHYEVAAPSRTMLRGPRRAWHQQRAGSLVTLNQVAVNLGIQLWLDLLAGAVTESRWCRLEWGENGLPVMQHHTASEAVCAVCRNASVRGLLPS